MRIELADLLTKYNLTAEQKLLIESFYNTYDVKLNVPKQISNVEPLFFSGAIAGTEFLVYAATKLYLCFSICITENNGTVDAMPQAFHLANSANAEMMRIGLAYPMFAAPDKRYSPVTHEFKNLCFSRIYDVTGFTNINFIGFRITLL